MAKGIKGKERKRKIQRGMHGVVTSQHMLVGRWPALPGDEEANGV